MNLEEYRQAITPDTKITVLTGAGISAASGIPTFRSGEDALWSQYRPEELATARAFHADTELVWKWYDWRRQLIAQSEPNAAHHALVDLEKKADLVIVTQNVDGYHQQAGSTTVHEFHGSIWRVRCLDCGYERYERQTPLPGLPHCEKCGGLERPAVVGRKAVSALRKLGPGHEPGESGAQRLPGRLPPLGRGRPVAPRAR